MGLKVDRKMPDAVVKGFLPFGMSVLILAGLYYASAIIAPVTFAVFIITIVWPLQSVLERTIPSPLALVVTLLITLATIGGLVLLFLWAFGLIVEWLVANADRFQVLYAQATEWLYVHGVSIEALVADSYSPSLLSGAARRVGGSGYRLVSFIIIAFAFTVLGLLEVDALRGKIEQLRNPKIRETFLLVGKDIAAKMRRYMLVRSIMSVLTGLVVWCFALTAGIELATAWGIIAFVLNYIPFIGPLVATVFPTLFALVKFGSLKLAIGVFACLNFIQFFIGSYLEPRIAGAALSISPFVVLLAVFFWSFLWGISGAFMGVPIMIAVLALCQLHDSTQWIATLLAGKSTK